MLPNSELTVPVNNDKARTLLARRGDELRWFTPLGFKNMPNIYTKDNAGKSVVIPNDGWSLVDPSAFRQPPPKTTESQVVSPQTPVAEKKPAPDAGAPVVSDQTNQDQTNPATGNGNQGDQ